jgi:DNA-binding CsgD family transcriptional regulator
MKISSNHLFLSSAGNIQQICAPLLAYDIDHFSYTRNYADGKRIYFSTHPHLLDSYFQKKLYRVGSCENKPENYDKTFMLWSTIPQKKLYADAHLHGLPEGVFIAQPSCENFTEFFNFATTHAQKNIANIYLSHFEVLTKFMTYFKDEAESLIIAAEKLSFNLPFSTATSLANKNSILAHSSKPLLTPQQFQCARYLLNGHTFKEIGLALQLSSRTVESYVENMKDKLGINNKTLLILKLNDMLRAV